MPPTCQAGQPHVQVTRKTIHLLGDYTDKDIQYILRGYMSLTFRSDIFMDQCHHHARLEI